MLMFNKPPSFTYKHITYLPPCPKEGVGSLWSFTQNVKAICDPLFAHCKDNYDIEALLIKARVIGLDDVSDTEADELIINFPNREAAHLFIDNLMAYIDHKWELFITTFDQKLIKE